MKVVGVLAGAFVMAGAMASQATSKATESVNGRWAADPAICSHMFGAEQPLVVTESSIRWSSDACRIERTYKAGDTVHIQAMCWGDAGEKSVPVSLRAAGGKLVVTWDRGARGALGRCP